MDRTRLGARCGIVSRRTTTWIYACQHSYTLVLGWVIVSGPIAKPIWSTQKSRLRSPQRSESSPGPCSGRTRSDAFRSTIARHMHTCTCACSSSSPSERCLALIQNSFIVEPLAPNFLKGYFLLFIKLFSTRAVSSQLFEQIPC